MSLGEDGAVAADSGPVAGQPVDAALVKTGGAPRALSALEQTRVNDDERTEHDGARERPPGRDHRASKCEPEQERHRCRDQQSKIRDAEVCAIEIGDALSPRLQTPLVFGDRLPDLKAFGARVCHGNATTVRHGGAALQGCLG